MVTCAVASCKNTSTKISKNTNGISFHRFPRDKERRRRWEVAVSREADWSATSFSSVCSEHFNASDFYLTERGFRRLSLEAVPSINISPCQEPEPTISQQEPIDIKDTDSEEVIKLKHKIRRLEVLAENRKKRILSLWRGKKRLKKKVDKMTGIIKHLIKIKSSESIFNYNGVQV